MFGAATLIGYLTVLVCLLIIAFQIRKANEGYINFKTLFQTLFIAVLIFEFFYSSYNYVHLKWIDSSVIEKLKSSMLSILDKAGDKISETDRDKSLARFDELKKITNVVEVIKGYFSSIAISGIFALIISAVVRRTKPAFEEQ